MQGRTQFLAELFHTVNLDDFADVVRLIFSLAIGDEVNPSLGVKSIATVLNMRGFQCRGKTWKSQKVWEILDSSTYYGDYFFNKRNARTRGNPPINNGTQK
ncbi:MAG: recombinase family protein [Candidatus Thiodiazotropha endolucinida]